MGSVTWSASENQLKRVVRVATLSQTVPMARSSGLGRKRVALPAAAALCSWCHSTQAAVDVPATSADISRVASTIDAVWVVVAAILVFWMQPGFALLEAGFCRSKNVVNVLMKNVMDLSLGTLAYCAIGFALMFGTTNGIVGVDGFFLSDIDTGPRGYSFVLFQLMFCATSATIVSGAMAERTRFGGYLIVVFAVTTLIYPVFGSWAWGSSYRGQGWLEAGDGSWLAQMGLPPFVDVAGSTVVHSLGGWVALAGALTLGPRSGKYNAKGQAQPLLGHSMVLATLGGLMLWMGWFGFNAGSALTAFSVPGSSGAGETFAYIALNTHIAAASGACGAMLLAWWLNGKPDIGITINGALGGLVSVTAGCATLTPGSAALVGLIAGGLVYSSVLLLDRLQIDDPVGAISVHAGAGLWGTIATGIFWPGSNHLQIVSQLIGAAACFAWAFGSALLVFGLIRRYLGLRVSLDAEEQGLDLCEHASDAYPPDLAGAIPLDDDMEPGGLPLLDGAE